MAAQRPLCGEVGCKGVMGALHRVGTGMGLRGESVPRHALRHRASSCPDGPLTGKWGPAAGPVGPQGPERGWCRLLHRRTAPSLGHGSGESCGIGSQPGVRAVSAARGRCASVGPWGCWSHLRWAWQAPPRVCSCPNSGPSPPSGAHQGRGHPHPEPLSLTRGGGEAEGSRGLSGASSLRAALASAEHAQAPR